MQLLKRSSKLKRGIFHHSLSLYLTFQHQTMVFIQIISIWLLLKNNILLNFVSLFVCLFFSFLPSSIANVRPVIGHCSYANTFNPSTAKNYQYLISLHNIPPESNINVHQSLFLLKVSYLNGLLSLELLFRER